MLEPYIINCGGFKVVPPVCGFAVWGKIVGEITDQTDLIDYLVANYQPLNDWLTDISELMDEGQRGDLFTVNGDNEIVRVPVGNNGDLLQTVGGYPTWVDVPTILEEYASLDNLSDVNIEVLQEGDLLRYVDGEWINITLETLLEDIDFGDLNDVNFTSLTAGDFVRWDGSAWVNIDIEDIVTALSSVMSLDDLSNVSNADSAPTNNLLVKTAGDWQTTSPSSMASNINLGDLGDVSITGPSTGQVLRRSGSNWSNANLSSGNVENDSGVSGGSGNVSGALDNLNGRVTSLENSGGGVAPAEPLKMIRGQLGAGGVWVTPASGPGWTATEISTGVWDIDFDVGLGITSNVSANITTAVGGPYNPAAPLTSFAITVPITTSGFRIATYRWTGSATEWLQEKISFSFLIMWS